MLSAATVAAQSGVTSNEDCPRAANAVVERFISADCALCWTQAPPAPQAPDAWTIDWIVPGAQGDDAPLASAAPREAAERVARLRADVFAAGPQDQRRTPLSLAKPPRLSVASGPAWHGYLGLQFDTRGPWPAGASGWLALVEAVPAGTDGTPVPRRLVRVVAGPFDLARLASGRTVRELRALRWPETAQPVRLRAMAWIETTDGRIVAMAAERCPRPRPR